MKGYQVCILGITKGDLMDTTFKMPWRDKTSKFKFFSNIFVLTVAKFSEVSKQKLLFCTVFFIVFRFPPIQDIASVASEKPTQIQLHCAEMSQEQDLDADLELFERQIKEVARAARQQSTPLSEESVARPTHHPFQDNPSSRPAQHHHPSHQPPKQLPKKPNHVQPTRPSPFVSTKNAAKWKWDNAAKTWRWTAPQNSLPVTSNPTPTIAPNITPNSNTLAAQPSNKETVNRTAAGEVWTDPTLSEWPENDYRIFVGDLAPDTTDEQLHATFSTYTSYNMSRIVRDKRTGECRGYAFVSFADGREMVRAMREKNGKYVGSRPVKLKRSDWRKRNAVGARRSELKAFRKILKK